MKNANSNQQCSQEPRLSQLEASTSSISETLKDVRDILKKSIQAEERIATLQEQMRDQKKCLRTLELAYAGAKWVERAVWVVLTGGLGLFWRMKE